MGPDSCGPGMKTRSLSPGPQASPATTFGGASTCAITPSPVAADSREEQQLDLCSVQREIIAVSGSVASEDV